MLIYTDSADHYTTNATVIKKYTSQVGTSAVGSSGNGRRSTQSLRLSGTDTVSLTIPSQDTYILGFAIRAVTLPASFQTVCGFREGATNHIDLRLGSTGTLQVTRNGTVLGSGTAVLATNTYYYVEFKAKIGEGTSGTYEVRVNETVDIISSGADTQNGGTGFIDNFFLGGINVVKDFDDIYLCNILGSDNTSFLGDVKVEAIFPDGDDTPLQWTPSTGSTHYNLLDEVPPNDDTDYVTTSGTDFDDIYTFQPLTSVSGTVLGVQILTYDRKTDAGGVNIRHLLKVNGTVYTGLLFAEQDNYIYHYSIVEQNPDTETDWTIADVNSASFGIRRL